MYGAFVNNTSRRVIDSELAGYTFSHKANVTIASGSVETLYNTGIPTTDISPPSIFYRPENAYAPIRLFASGSTWFVSFLCGGASKTINLVIFRRRYLASPSGHGMLMRNSANQITFNSSDTARAIWVRGYTNFSQTAATLPAEFNNTSLAIMFYATRIGVISGDGFVFEFGFYTFTRLSGSLQYTLVSLYSDLDCDIVPTQPNGTNNQRVIPMIDINDY